MYHATLTCTFILTLPASCGVMMSVSPPIEQLTCTPTTSLVLTCRVEMKLLMVLFTNTTVNPSSVRFKSTRSKSAINVTPVGGSNTPVLLVVHLTAVPVPAQVQNSVVLGHSSAVAVGLQVILAASEQPVLCVCNNQMCKNGITIQSLVHVHVATCTNMFMY